ncbi:MAG: ABC transporter substrate-binding protein [Anaerolineales bacterium]|nr:ABC transporter substrate-binding protein [Anaerolineales bacterium]
MKTKKKFTIWSLISMLLLVSMLFSACGTDAAPQDTTDGEEGAESSSSELPVEIDFAYPTFNKVPEGDALASVEEAINAITVPDINVTVKLHPYSIVDYSTQINLAIQSGEGVDVFTTLGDLPQSVTQNKIIDITDMIDEYAPEAKEIVGEDFLKATTMDGKLYGIPAYKGVALAPNLVYRSDIMEAIGVDAASIASLDDLTDVFAKVKEQYPDMVPLVPVDTGSIGLVTTLHGIDFLGDSYLNPIAVLVGDDMNVVNFYKTDEFTNLVTLARDWYDQGFVLKDAATTTSTAIELMSSGKGFAYIAAYSGHEAYTQIAAQTGQPIQMVRLGEPYLSTSSVNALTWVIASTSEHPEAALKFMNKIFADKEVINLIIYGIEGRDYIQLDADHVNYPEGQDASTVPYTAQLACGIVGNQFIQYQMEGTDMGDIQVMLDENINADISPAMGFSFDSSGVTNEYTAVINVIEQYVPGLITGSVDPAEIPEFLDKLEAAGIDKIVEAKQQQLDQWLSMQE